MARACVIAVGVALIATLLSGAGAGAAGHPDCRKEAGVFVDPRRALPLPSDALAGATRAALAFEIQDARALWAARAPYAPDPRGNEPRLRCGKRIWRRSVLVALNFPHAGPSASLSQGLVVVSRFRERGHPRYRVWEVLH